MSVDCSHGSHGYSGVIAGPESNCPECRMVRIEAALERIVQAVERQDRAEAPLIDGCRIVHRGDGFDVCMVHRRHWKAGTEMCPGSRGR